MKKIFIMERGLLLIGVILLLLNAAVAKCNFSISASDVLFLEKGRMLHFQVENLTDKDLKLRIFTENAKVDTAFYLIPKNTKISKELEIIEAKPNARVTFVATVEGCKSIEKTIEIVVPAQQISFCGNNTATEQSYCSNAEQEDEMNDIDANTGEVEYLPEEVPEVVIEKIDVNRVDRRNFIVSTILRNDSNIPVIVNIEIIAPEIFETTPVEAYIAPYDALEIKLDLNAKEVKEASYVMQLLIYYNGTIESKSFTVKLSEDSLWKPLALMPQNAATVAIVIVIIFLFILLLIPPKKPEKEPWIGRLK